MNTQFQKNLIYVAVGYFMYDFICMAAYGLLDWAMTLHHFFTSVGMTLALVNGNSGNMIVFGMFIAEVSNPAMHIRTILRHLGLRYTKAYEAFEISFIMLYGYARLFLGTSMVWRVCSCEATHWFQKLSAVFLLLQSIHFVKQMVEILRKRFNEISNRKISGIKMKWFEPLDKEQLSKLGLSDKKENHIL